MTASTAPPATLLPVARAVDLDPRPPEQRWLIEGLWGHEAVGIVGGEPKSCKSFLALDIAVAVASGAPCLRRFPVARTGRVLLFAAEDALGVVRHRLEGICAAAGVELAALDLDVITAPTLRIDTAADQQRLADTVAALRPTLLILDPLSGCTASTKTSAPRSHRCSRTCATSSAASRSRSSSCTMHARAPDGPAPARPCAARRNSTRGSIRPSTFAAPTTSSPSPSSIAPHHHTGRSRSGSSPTPPSSRSPPNRR